MSDSTGPERIAHIVVAGGGLVGWSAAAALKRRIPGVAVSLIPTATPANALADRISSALPSILQFHADLRLADSDTILRAGSSIRAGTRFAGWRAGQPPYVHAYGNCGLPLGASAFHQQWLRADAREAALFESYCPSAAAAKEGRLPPPEAPPGSPFASCELGLELDPGRYREMMRAFALHLGVEELGGGIAEVRLDPGNGFIAAVRLTDGAEAKGDLFVDCSGPEALLRSKLGGGFEEWERWLRCDRILLGEAPPPADPSLLTAVAAEAAGWSWRAEGFSRTTLGLVYCSAHLDEDGARAAFAAGEPIRADGEAAMLRQGRWSEPWLRNCVAVGDAAAAVEPLEWANLHLAHGAIDRIVAMMPARDCAPIELVEYNRQCGQEADRVRDFLILHYLTARRDEPFWREAASAEPPATLAHSLSLFLERGRLPYYEEETFTRDSWLAVLLGQEIRPRRIDPLVETVPAEQVEQSLQRMRDSLQALVPSLPTQRHYLETMARRPPR